MTAQTLAALVASIPVGTSVPWQKKRYALKTVAHTELLGNAPKQVRALLETAGTHFPNGKDFSGKELADKAKETGALSTKQKPELIFAYYRRTLEAFGLETVSSTAAEKTTKTTAAPKAPEAPAVPAQQHAAKGKGANAPKQAKTPPKAAGKATGASA